MHYVIPRHFDQANVKELIAAGTPSVLARIFASRGISSDNDLTNDLSFLLPFSSLKNILATANYLADAIEQKKRFLIISDYDADGATACAVALRGFKQLGGLVDFIVPNRFEYGYGLTTEIVDLACTRSPDVIITVDNGIASVDGVARAKSKGIEVCITDHHLPAENLPDTQYIVNPNQRGCEFPSKNLAGVGVIFYVLLAVRAELRRRGAFAARNQPNFSELLDIVALGTVADVVSLDNNNRILVHQGLRRIRAGRAHAGINALFKVSRCDYRKAKCYELGFVLGPRLNAAGRLDDMSLGIECLTTDNPQRAFEIATQLDALNRERREIEASMHNGALLAIEDIEVRDTYSVCLYRPDWHQGIIGILASRMKEKIHRPVIAFAPDNNGDLKGSGRSIPTLHLRDALDLVSKRYPGIIKKFGGHAFAAGLSIAVEHFEEFTRAFEAIVKTLLTPAELARKTESDGVLQASELTLETAKLLDAHVWGQGFPEPCFYDFFEVAEQRIISEKHLKLKLNKFGKQFEAMLFFKSDPLPPAIHALYRLSVNEYNGTQALQLTIDQLLDNSPTL